jgi:thiol-disulfide isomerase/thioredoxin
LAPLSNDLPRKGLAFGVTATNDSHRHRAPPIVSKIWINSAPIRPADVRGKVVLVEFWTFGCGNCQANVPAMRRLWKDYRNNGLLVIAVHTPETDSERDPEHVRHAITRMKIYFPVALDNDYRIWRSFGSRYWPTIYLIDAHGALRSSHIGELHEGTSEWRDLTRRIEALVAEAPTS